MKTRDIVLLVVLSCGAAAGFFAAAAYLFIRRRRRKREGDEDGTSCAIRVEHAPDSGREKSRLNGFLSLKTPLISTKTLGCTVWIPVWNIHGVDSTPKPYPGYRNIIRETLLRRSVPPSIDNIMINSLAPNTQKQ